MRAEVALHVGGLVFAALVGPRAIKRLRGRQPVVADNRMRLAAKQVAAHARARQARRGGTRGNRRAGTEAVQEILQHRQVSAGAVGVAELHNHHDLPRRLMRELQQREHAPGVGGPAPRFPIAAIDVQQLRKAPGRHARPVECNGGDGHFARGLWQRGETIAGDHAEVAAARAAAGTEQVRVARGVDGARHDVAARVHRQDVDRAQPVARQPLQARQQAVAAARDVAARRHRIARAAGQGHAMTLV
ncbi:hypothetical protein D3C72_746310 [compost metagenome]